MLEAVNKIIQIGLLLIVGVFACLESLYAAELNLSNTPLFVRGSKTALVQLVMQRDNKLFFEAYPSYEDINGDGVLDIRYKPHEIDYYGYFDSNFCYQSLNGDNLEAVAHGVDKKCSIGWSGDYLNFLSMTRMDIILKSLYGGKRLVDRSGETILRRAFVPWENHTWGIEYTSLAVDGYLISDYSPLATPTAGRRHHISTSNVNKDDVPYLRIRRNVNQRIWQWVDKERSQGDGWASDEFILDVKVCKDGFLEESCQQYPDNGYKPVGLLHEYGENDSMYFSLLTGSFDNNLQGGVLRQAMDSFGTNEVNPHSGVFTAYKGIVATLDAVQIPNDYHSGTVQTDCEWINDREFHNGECRAWGNPIAEMMYEGMRYLSGDPNPTSQFVNTTGTMDSDLGLATAAWDDPYSVDKPWAQCSGAYQLVISDPSPSFDGDQLPGSFFEDFTDSTLGNLHVSNLARKISSHEIPVPALKFIGQVGTKTDGSPSPKEVDSFHNIRGQSPEAPHRQGSYYAPSVAYYGHQNDIHPLAPGKQTVGNFTLALGSPLPAIDVDVGGHTISFAPFAKTVNFCGSNTAYKPTNAIVGFTVEEVTATSGSYRVSFEDMEQGADNDMDAVARFKYQVSGNSVIMETESLTASGCAVQHMGYTVSGTVQDGVYLVVRDSDTKANKDSDFELDVPPGQTPGSGWNDGKALPLTSTITFAPSSTPAAEQLPSPLWYAAKWGGFTDINADGIPQGAEWDADGDNIPDNFFSVTNPSRMAQTMRSVFNSISEEAGAASAIATSTGSLNTGNRIYRAEFRSGKWTGELISQQISDSGVIDPVVDWRASEALATKIAAGTREILSYNPDSEQGVAFRWPTDEANPAVNELTALQMQALNRNPITDLQDNLGMQRLRYVRGNHVDGFRRRASALGDIVHSSPVLVGAPGSYYPDSWGANAPENAQPYTNFGRDRRNRNRVVYVGANDGMLHAFDAGTYSAATGWSAGTGDELFAYVPSPVFPRLSDLADPKYSHKYFVDATPRAADVFIDGAWRTVLIGALGRGGQGVYALDVTDPASINEQNADDAVLWEFTDREDRGVGFIYSSPVIARMHNGKWAAIFANGYNNSTAHEGYKRGGGWSSVIIVDIETGQLVRKLHPVPDDCKGNDTTPNSMAEPTAVDFDRDRIVDGIYAGDLYGCVYYFDVSSDNPSNWEHGELKHRAIGADGSRAPITSAISVGSHPTGTGVLLYFGTGKYLEPSDQYPDAAPHRVYAIWDKGPDTNTAALTAISAKNLLQQSITREEIYTFDTDGDGLVDDSIPIRETSSHAIDWSVHEGWYLDLIHNNYLLGEQILTAPILRDGKVLLTTHIPVGNECIPEQQGWFMVLEATSGAMPARGLLDLNGDGRLNEPPIAGAGNLTNPFAPPALMSSGRLDFILSQNETEPEPNSVSMATGFSDGRVTWRELEP